MIADLTKSAFDSFMRTFNAMPEDRRDWSPAPRTRSALNMLWEIATVNELFVDFLRGKSEKELKFESLAEIWCADCPHSSTELAQRAEDVTLALIEAIRVVSDEQLEVQIKVNQEAYLPTKTVMWMGLRNLWYHCGQANYLQTLYGDRDMH